MKDKTIYFACTISLLIFAFSLNGCKTALNPEESGIKSQGEVLNFGWLEVIRNNFNKSSVFEADITKKFSDLKIDQEKSCIMYGLNPGHFARVWLYPGKTGMGVTSCADMVKDKKASERLVELMFNGLSANEITVDKSINNGRLKKKDEELSEQLSDGIRSLEEGNTFTLDVNLYYVRNINDDNRAPREQDIFGKGKFILVNQKGELLFKITELCTGSFKNKCEFVSSTYKTPLIKPL